MPIKFLLVGGGSGFSRKEGVEVIFMGAGIFPKGIALYPPNLGYRKLRLRPEALVQAAQQRGHRGITKGVSQLKLCCGGYRAIGGYRNYSIGYRGSIGYSALRLSCTRLWVPPVALHVSRYTCCS